MKLLESIRSPFVAELIHKKITIAREAARDAADATAKVAHAAERELDEQTSAFIAWAAAVGADVDDTREARMVLQMNEFEDSMSLERFLREGYRLWVDAGKDEARFRQARIDLAGRGRPVAWRWL